MQALPESRKACPPEPSGSPCTTWLISSPVLASCAWPPRNGQHQPARPIGANGSGSSSDPTRTTDPRSVELTLVLRISAPSANSSVYGHPTGYGRQKKLPRPLCFVRAVAFFFCVLRASRWAPCVGEPSGPVKSLVFYLANDLLNSASIIVPGTKQSLFTAPPGPVPHLGSQGPWSPGWAVLAGAILDVWLSFLMKKRYKKMF